MFSPQKRRAEGAHRIGGILKMRPFNLNEEEIAFVQTRRLLTGPQRELVDYLARSFAQEKKRKPEPLPANVIALLARANNS